MGTHSFAYSTDTITGTLKYGNLVVGTSPQDLNFSGYSENPKFWMGPEEDNRYVIATTLQAKDQPTPAPFPDDFAYVTFWATNTTNPVEFIDLAEYCSDWYGSPQTFNPANPIDAKIWLNNNGFWVNYPG
jgi:hypothetical protein